MSNFDKSLENKLEQSVRANIGHKFANIVMSGKLNEFRLRSNVSRMYKTKFSALCNKFTKETGSTLKSRGDYKAMAHWLADVHRHNVGPKSWYIYRTAFKKTVDDAELVSIVDVESTTSKDLISSERSANRVKTISDADMSIILTHLKKSKSKYAEPTYRLLLAVRKLGIRPSEILDAHLIQFSGFYFFKVRTLKSDNHISGDKVLVPQFKYRYIPTLHMNDAEIHLVDLTCKTFQKIGDVALFEKLYESIRFTLLAALKSTALFKKGESLSLYSARSQFSSDLKKTPLSEQMRSMIMGHNDVNTLRHHYGRKSNGTALFEPNAAYEKTLYQLFNSQI